MRFWCRRGGSKGISFCSASPPPLYFKFIVPTPLRLELGVGIVIIFPAPGMLSWLLSLKVCVHDVCPTLRGCQPGCRHGSIERMGLQNVGKLIQTLHDAWPGLSQADVHSSVIHMIAGVFNPSWSVTKRPSTNCLIAPKFSFCTSTESQLNRLNGCGCRQSAAY